MVSDPKAQAALALYRFGLGPRAGSIAGIASDPRGALLAELDGAGAGRIGNADLLTSGTAARVAFAFQQAQRAARQAERAAQQAAAPSGGASLPQMKRSVRAAAGASASAQSGSRDAAADLSRGSQGAHPGRARRRDRLPRAARLVLVEPFLRVGGQGQRAPDLRRL